MSEVLTYVWNALIGIVVESWNLFAQMAPYLIIGFIFAGILHVFVSVKRISRHLGKSNFISVLKATLFGIPLPLCSCSVIPTVSTLHSSGASKGATLAFLISTPTSGVDSILATYSLLGPVFTIYRIFASFVAGVFSGVSANIFDRKKSADENVKKIACPVCGEHTDDHHHSFGARVRAMIAYSFGELVRDIGKWVLIGTLIGGAIAYFVPAGLITTYLSSPILQMLLMLVLSIPLYICATGSLPIAAALIMKGISPGAAMVLLIAGPATNAVTLTVVSKTLGRRSLIIYLSSIIITALGMGFLFDLLPWSAPTSSGMMVGMFEFPQIVKIIAAVLILGLIAYQIVSGIVVKSRHKRHEHECKEESSSCCSGHGHEPARKD
ncbi:SO_0444 family Cu/Zn efflux transporter [candidate division WOR-3 bacterium]|uniref:SO_0444 family Cu/Zn efflux transporter n=1 Tax=candidate division WOR-3 bacterium TaxID=2052148 RepID=A0A9D5QCT9_UNCW3|nr:SO_0444 family Cu/Zn efflux transporter [candidate division WOR-3 bacterium]MBD3364919.1 SO_0444 family Cu/Zn efflux transporter [candidate division WOR-3 bacterium]